MRDIRWSLLICSLCVVNFPVMIHAQTGFDGSLGGAVVAGYDSRACDSTIEGALRYNSSAGKVQICTPSGSSSCPNIGDLCSDGSVYAGLSPDGDVPMYTTPEDAGQYPWNNGNSSNNTTTSQTSDTTGANNTANLITIDSDSGTSGTQPHQAAQVCADLTAHGHTDWHLPARDELSVLYTNHAAIGSFETTTDWSYWSSTENGSNIARIIQFNDGDAWFDGKDYAFQVRCVRKSITPPEGFNWNNWGE